MRNLKVVYSDLKDLGPGKKSSSSPIRPESSKVKAKQVNFLDKFGDPETLDENTSWDLDTNSYENNNRAEESLTETEDVYYDHDD